MLVLVNWHIVESPDPKSANVEIDSANLAKFVSAKIVKAKQIREEKKIRSFKTPLRKISQLTPLLSAEQKKSFTESPAKEKKEAVRQTPSFWSQANNEFNSDQQMVDSDKLMDGYNSSPEIMESVKRINEQAERTPERKKSQFYLLKQAVIKEADDLEYESNASSVSKEDFSFVWK